MAIDYAHFDGKSDEDEDLFNEEEEISEFNFKEVNQINVSGGRTFFGGQMRCRKFNNLPFSG